MNLREHAGDISLRLLVFISLLAGADLAAHLAVPPLGALPGSAILLGFLVAGGIVAARLLPRSVAVLAAVAAALPAAATAYDIHRDEQIRTGPRAEQIALAEAPGHGDALVITLRDGRVRPDLSGAFTRRDVREEVRSDRVKGIEITCFAVAPVVGAGWKRDQPVRAWAACPAFSGTCTSHAVLASCRGRWEADHRAGVVLRTAGTRRAVKVAERVHGLRSAAAAPVLQWSADPEADLAEGDQMRLALVLLAHLLAAGAMAMFGFLSLRRPRQKEPGAG